MDHEKYFGKSLKQNWETPDWVFEWCDNIFSFTLDTAAEEGNKKVKNFYSREKSAMEHPWNGRVWCNPPYSKEKGVPGSVGVKEFLARGLDEFQKNEACQMICFLVAAATDSRWFQDYCFSADYLVFIKGRLKFNGAKNSQTKGSALVIFTKIPLTADQLIRLQYRGVVVVKKSEDCRDYQCDPV